MPNFLVVAERADGEQPIVAYGNAFRAAALIETFDSSGYNVKVHKVTAPLTDEAVAELRRGLSSAG